VHADKGGFRLEAVSQPLSLLKTVNYQESLKISQRDRCPVGTRDLIRRMSLADPVWVRLASTARCASSASK